MEPHEQSIQRLLNSMVFGVEMVFILFTETHFRLVGLNSDETVIDKEYRTLRGAKVAFTKLFQGKAFRQGLQPEWSHAYPVKTTWLKPKLAICNRNSPKNERP